MSNYNVIPTFWDETLESWVWLNDNTENGFVVIENLNNGKRIKTYKRTIDNNVIDRINERSKTSCIVNFKDCKNLLIINEYYRKKLGLNVGCINNLKIKNANCIERLLLIPWDHPNPIVQYANRSSLIAIILGLIALILTVVTLF